MKLIFGLILYALFLSCKKESETTSPSRQLISKLQYVVSGGDMVKFSFNYDDKQRLIARSSSDGSTKTFHYVDDRLAYVYYASPSYSDTIFNYSYYSSDMDTIKLGLRKYNDITLEYDTTQKTLIFSNGHLVEMEEYKFQSGITPGRGFTRYYLSYNSQGNLYKLEEFRHNNERREILTVRSWDDKINPLRRQPRENFFENIIPSGLQSTSANNPVSIFTGMGIQEVEMKYDQQGYPLSFEQKNFPATKFEVEYLLVKD